MGSALLRDAILCTIEAAEIAGIRAILVHAISDRAKRFNEGWGFLTSPVNGDTYFVARDVKQMKDLADRSVLETLSITLIAMELRGIDWGLVISDSEEFPHIEWENVDWTYRKHDLKKAFAFSPDTVWEIARSLNSDIAASKSPVILRNICSASDRMFGLQPGTAMSIARFLVANKAWEIDMRTRLITPSSPMEVGIDRFEQTMERLCGRR